MHPSGVLWDVGNVTIAVGVEGWPDNARPGMPEVP